MEQWKPRIDKEYLRQRLGHMSQLAGLKRYELIEGRAKGIEAVDVRTGSGFEYTVLPGRGMDLAWASYKGIPVSYISQAEISSPSYYEPDGVGWLRGFFAGLMTTCGLGNVGAPAKEEDPVLGIRRHGLHGRISYTPAIEIATREEWISGRYQLFVEGRLIESLFNGERLSLRRKICSYLGENQLCIQDRIENEGNETQPVMIMYHINIGYPILDETARLLIPFRTIHPHDRGAEAELNHFDQFDKPTPGYQERCYFHTVRPLDDGQTAVAVINDALGLGLMISYDPDQLPCLTQWKMLNQGEYVLGLEPGTTFPLGRTEAGRQGFLQYLEPGQAKEIQIRLRLLVGKEEIEEARTSIISPDSLARTGATRV